MRSRDRGMWWGVAIEAPDPAALARFYAALLEWTVGHEEPGTSILAASERGPYLVFQAADGYQRPVWPPEPGRQRPMLHLDIQVGDLAGATEEAISLGAVPASEQPNESVRVLLDPAGHPFCLCVDD